MSIPTVQIPKTAKAAVLRERGKPYEIVHNWEVQEPKVGEVLIKLRTSGCCYSDIMPWNPKYDNFRGTLPLVGGHEGIGEIVAHGEGVTSPPIGSRVGVRWDAYSCGKCEPCISGNENRCPSDMKHGFLQPGTFQEYLAAHSEFVIPIPDDIDDVQAAPMMCAGVTVFKAIKVAQPLPGQWLTVVGAGGGMGHLLVQLGKATGLRVLGIDSGAKEQFARRCGVDVFLDYTKTQDLVADVNAITNGGTHISIITPNDPLAYTQAVGYARFLGKIICLSVTELRASTQVIYAKMLQITGVATGNRLDVREMLETVSRRMMKAEVEVRRLEDLEQTLKDLEAGRILGRVVFRISE